MFKSGLSVVVVFEEYFNRVAIFTELDRDNTFLRKTLNRAGDEGALEEWSQE